MKIPFLNSNPLSNSSSYLIKGGVLIGSLSLGQWLMTDVVHIPTSGFAVLLGGASIWWLSKPSKNSFDSPQNVQGWIKRCNEVIEQFESLEDEKEALQNKNSRTLSIQSIIKRGSPQQIGFVSASKLELPSEEKVNSALATTKPLEISWLNSLPIPTRSLSLPSHLLEKDCLIYIIEMPLKASDLLWLEKIPHDQQAWLIVASDKILVWQEQLNTLQAQLPERWKNTTLLWNTNDENLESFSLPIRRALNHQNKNINLTKQRLLSKLHQEWQSQIERIRREKFRSIQNRTQWIVAGAVFASPVASTDLLSVAVVNGLMMQEMAELWSCSWKPEMLNIAARQLALAAISEGVVEWSGQALLSLAKVHSGAWIAAGTMQALSAAYLTRVVGTSMADWMALNNGVAKPDLELLKRQAPELISKAAEQERVDWSAFLQQARLWLSETNLNSLKRSDILEGS